MSVLVGRKAPDFCVPAVLSNGSIVNEYRFSEAVQAKYSLIFFYPLDFTFVCPTELIALDRRIDAFSSREVEVIAISVDSHFTHDAFEKKLLMKAALALFVTRWWQTLPIAFVNPMVLSIQMQALLLELRSL